VSAGRPPNLVLLVTDQQRAPQHWPQDPAWLDALMPNDAQLRRTGMSFERAFIPTAMCSPCRATLLTGVYPSRHGVSLTMTRGDLLPDPRNARDAFAAAAGLMRSGEVPRARVAKAFGRGLLQTIVKLSSRNLLRISIGEILAGDGTAIHQLGIEPDLTVPARFEPTGAADRDFDFAASIVRRTKGNDREALLRAARRSVEEVTR